MTATWPNVRIAKPTTKKSKQGVPSTPPRERDGATQGFSREIKKTSEHRVSGTFGPVPLRKEKMSKDLENQMRILALRNPAARSWLKSIKKKKRPAKKRV